MGKAIRGARRKYAKSLSAPMTPKKTSLHAQLDQVQIPLNACDDSYLTALVESQRLVDELQNLIPLCRKSGYDMRLCRLQMVKTT